MSIARFSPEAGPIPAYDPNAPKYPLCGCTPCEAEWLNKKRDYEASRRQSKPETIEEVSP